MTLKATETEWTGLSLKECDALRDLAREERLKGNLAFQLPTSPLALVRFYWEKIEKKPCPQHLLEGVPGYEPGPSADKEAQAIAEELGLDLRQILPTGPSGTVTKDDVLKHVTTKFAKYMPGPATRKTLTKGASGNIDDFLGAKE